MTTAETISYIESYTWSAARLGLDRTRALLAALGDPQRGLKFVHVAGSNGKGSTCAMLDAILREAGLRVGLYTSPYLQDFRERIRVNGADIPGARLAEITHRVRVFADAMEDHPSQFELVTAIAMVYFLEEGCDIVVLEVGMGGELDSTNVIDPPEVAVLTNIGLEHTEYLGHTLEEIAATKAGILKPGCDGVCYDGAPQVTKVVKQVCEERGIPFHLADFSKITPLEHSLAGQTFRYDGERYALPLLGRHQLCNAAVALETVKILRKRGWKVDRDAVERGLAGVEWPARFEVLSHEPLFILDGGHNPQCASALADLLTDYLPGEKVTLLMGVLEDKDVEAMLDALAPHAKSFVCVTPDSPRALPAEKLAEMVEKRFSLPARACATVEAGVQTALEGGGPVVACGSLYLAGQVRTALPGLLKPFQRRLCLARRRELGDVLRGSYSHLLCQQLTGLPKVETAGVILSYMATWDEADLAEFHRWAADRGKVLAFPVTGPDGSMEAMVPAGADAFVTGAYGIRTPDPARARLVPPEELEMVLLPCVGFDAGGRRLGHGAGYYDRYLARCPQATRVLVGFEAQRLDRVSVEPQDLHAETVATEMGLFPVGE